MAGGGFANHAMNVIKANRALLNKRKRLSRADYIGVATGAPVESKDITPGQMRAVRLKIAANKRREIKIWIISICLSLILLWGIYYWMVN